jgi:putative ABC transport system ATP-binding protein
MIVVREIKKYFDNGLVKALNGISFRVEKGEMVSIMGPSGCGKSTLLNLIGALDLPTGGEIWIDGKNLMDHRPFQWFRSRYVGFVFQFHHLLPNLTLLENVELPLFTSPIPKKLRRDKAAALLIEMGLEDRLHFLPTRVSGGERQRAAIARALVNDPRMILADEPTGNVDSETGERILDYLLGLSAEKQVTMLIATHSHEIAGRTQRILRMKNGRLEGLSSCERSG